MNVSRERWTEDDDSKRTDTSPWQQLIQLIRQMSSNTSLNCEDQHLLGLFQKLSSGWVGCRHFFVLWVEGVLLTCPRGGEITCPGVKAYLTHSEAGVN